MSEISEVDYFLKNDEFQVWLKEEKGKVSQHDRQSCDSLFKHVWHSLVVLQRAIQREEQKVSISRRARGGH